MVHFIFFVLGDLHKLDYLQKKIGSLIRETCCVETPGLEFKFMTFWLLVWCHTTAALCQQFNCLSMLSHFAVSVYVYRLSSVARHQITRQLRTTKKLSLSTIGFVYIMHSWCVTFGNHWCFCVYFYMDFVRFMYVKGVWIYSQKCHKQMNLCEIIYKSTHWDKKWSVLAFGRDLEPTLGKIILLC